MSWDQLNILLISKGNFQDGYTNFDFDNFMALLVKKIKYYKSINADQINYLFVAFGYRLYLTNERPRFSERYGHVKVWRLFGWRFGFKRLRKG